MSPTSRRLCGRLGSFVLATIAGWTMVAPAWSQAASPPTTAPATPPTPPQDQPAAQPTLTLGSRAPKLDVAEWIAGESLASLPAGATTVVAFWTPENAPCRESLRTLSALAGKFPKVPVVAVSFDESAGASDTRLVLSRRTPGCRVALDRAGATRRAWIDAAGVEDVPVAFVVDAKGQVAWFGHPSGSLALVLDRLDKGTWDTPSYAAKMKRADVAIDHLVNERVADGLEIIDTLLADDPALFVDLGTLKYQVLLQDMKQPARAYAFVKDAFDRAFASHAPSLMEIAWSIVDGEDLSPRDLDLALRCATRAATLTSEQDAYALDCLAAVHAARGDLAAAVVAQTKAVQVADDDAHKLELAEALREWQSKLAEQSGKATAPAQPAPPPAKK